MNKKAIDIIRSFKLNRNGKLRTDCPFCGHKNTLSISDVDGTLIWFCFHADCKTRGASHEGRTIESMRDRLSRTTITKAEKPKNFILPDYVVPIVDNERAVSYLRKNNAYDAYARGDARCLYDPKQDRVLFLVRRDGSTIDAVGRSLTRGVKPKWLRYGDSREPFLCGSNRLCVVVEDCASACAVSGVATGLALLGTNLMDTHVNVLKGFDRVLIALDKDATKKAIDMQRRLAHVVSCRAVRLDDDLKYLPPDKINQALGLSL